MVEGDGGSAKSDFIGKGAVIRHLMRGSKYGKNHLTSYMDGPLEIYKKKNWRQCSLWWSIDVLNCHFFFFLADFYKYRADCPEVIESIKELKKASKAHQNW